MEGGQETLVVLTEKFDELLSQWIRVQAEEGVRRSDLFSGEESRRQAARLLVAFRDCAQNSDRADLDFSAESWAPLREEVEDISRERTDRGVTPTQMANFINALKPPLFAALTERIEDPRDLSAELVAATRLIDALALYTTEIFQRTKDKIIERQRSEMIELSSPVVELWQGILAMPLIGSVDSARAQEVMENLLDAIVQRKATIVIIDITGVGTVDTQVAQHLLRTAAAVRLMGAECVISGISPTIAQTMVQLGVDVGEVVTRGSIRDALVHGFEKLGLTVGEADRLRPRHV